MERIASRKNQEIQYWRKLASSAAFRREQGEFLCDSPKLLEEAVSGDCPVTSLAWSGVRPSVQPDCPIYELTEELMAYASPAKTPQGVFFTCRIPERKADYSGERYVVLDGVQDPGNVGTILRTARAMGYDALWLLEGCADLYSPKTVRASMGAVFHQPAVQVSLHDVQKLKENGITLFGAALEKNSCDVRKVDFHHFAVCIGSEGRGLCRDLLDLCDQHIVIPMQKNCESLNAAAAAGIIMWESVRGQLCLD